MNRENVQLLRDTLAKAYLASTGFRRGGQRYGFNMKAVVGSTSEYLPDQIDGCGTACCLAGWTRLIRGEQDLTSCWVIDDGAWLGLSDTAGNALFKPLDEAHGQLPWSSITVPEALLVLDNLLATGRVDWSIIVKRREKIRANGYVPVAPVYGRPEAVS